LTWLAIKNEDTIRKIFEASKPILQAKNFDSTPKNKVTKTINREQQTTLPTNPLVPPILFLLLFIHQKMGACLSAIGGPKIPELVSDEQLKAIEEKTEDVIQDLPDSFLNERWNILWEMWRADPKEYEDELFKTKLLWSEYPGNEKDVCMLAIKVACGDALKEILKDIAHELLDAKIDEEADKIPELLRGAAKKAADKAIEKAVDKGVDKGIKVLNEKIEKELGTAEGEKKEGGFLVACSFSEGTEKKVNTALDKHKKK